MLVLSRKEDQKVIIPGLDISIKVLRCKGSSVTLGFAAPPEVRIIRDELDSGIPVDGPRLNKFIDEKLNRFPKEVQHEMRDQFNVVTMTLQMLVDDIESGQLKDIDDVFKSVCQRLGKLKTTSNDEDAFVLLVEDQPNERELLAGILRMHGYRVATACDGIEALEYLENNGKPAFILVDMHLPRCDGAELLREIRKSVELAGVRVYVVSGCKEEDCDVNPDSIDGWYTKPIAPQEIIQALSAAN